MRGQSRNNPEASEFQYIERDFFQKSDFKKKEQ